MADKTQLATIALAAHYAQPVQVVAGTTIGMLLADVPAVFIGQTLAERLPTKAIRIAAAALLAAMGVFTWLGGDQLLRP